MATTHGYEELERWSRGLGEIHAFGIEGTGSYGAGVARFLTRRGHTVVEVNRPDRSTRYRKGKSDPTDAETAARAVLAGVADATPKSGEGEVEMIRMFKSTKDSAVKARTQAINQMKALVITAPARLREHLTGLTAAALVTRSKSFRPGRMEGPTAAAKYALRSLARRYRQLGNEIKELEADHRRHAEIENAIRDLKYGVGLNHMPSGRFAANGAWLAVQVMAHNLARWTARIGLGEQIATTKTLRRRVFALVGRITRSARRLTLHLPRRWPWETQFSRALARLQAIPFPA